MAASKQTIPAGPAAPDPLAQFGAEHPGTEQFDTEHFGTEQIRVERDESVPGLVRVVMQRGAQFNALSESMLADLTAALRGLADDRSVRVVVLCGDGRAFCAGHDLREMRREPSERYYRELFALCTKLMMQIRRMPQPVIARVQGIATAAGCQLVAMCDLAVAASDARFAVSGVNLGLFCSTPSVALSRNVPRKAAFEMLVTGAFVDAARALDLGLVNRIADVAALDDEVVALARQILAKPEPAIRMGKKLFYDQLEMGIEAAYQLAGQTMACNMMAPEALEGVQAFLEKRSPAWPADAPASAPASPSAPAADSGSP